MKSLRIRPVVRTFFGLFFSIVGVSHFTDPAPYLSIMPPYVPWHLGLVYISGFFEIAGGIGLLVPYTRRRAAWGLVALLVAIFPANIHMLMNEVYLEGMPQEIWLLWARLPVQLVFAAGVLWTGEIWPRAAPPETSPPASG
jgi:uncharacterized membrane protein